VTVVEFLLPSSSQEPSSLLAIGWAGQPAGLPDLKKPTTLRGVVGVWNCESTDEALSGEYEGQPGSAL
jgi:hypothetical protein